MEWKYKLMSLIYFYHGKLYHSDMSDKNRLCTGYKKVIFLNIYISLLKILNTTFTVNNV